MMSIVPIWSLFNYSQTMLKLLICIAFKSLQDDSGTYLGEIQYLT